MEVTTNSNAWDNLLPPMEQTTTQPNQFSEFIPQKEETLNDKIDKQKENELDPINEALKNKPETDPETPPVVEGSLDEKTLGYLNTLFEEGVIAPFEGSDIKTFDDFREVIQKNIESQVETVKQGVLAQELDSLSPQFQSVMKYGMNGGTDIKALLESWVDAERVINIDATTDGGKRQIVSEYLSSIGYGTQEEIQNDIKTWADLGTLDAKVDMYKPKLEELQMRRVLAQENQASQARAYEENFNSHFISSIESVLTEDKDYLGLELPLQLKQALYSQSQPQYVSQRTGKYVDALEAIVEEAKYGQNANPGFYTELMFHATYPEEYKKLLLSQTKMELALESERKLRSQVKNDISSNNHVAPKTNTNSIKPISY